MIQWYTRSKKEKAFHNCLEVASLEESLYPRLVPALDHDMVCESVDDTLGIRDIQFHLQSIAQYINVSVNLLDAGQSHVAAAFPQGVDGQFIGWCPRDEVGEVGCDFRLWQGRCFGDGSFGLRLAIGVVADLCWLRGAV
jgi:hypothetical protein